MTENSSPEKTGTGGDKAGPDIKALLKTVEQRVAQKRDLGEYSDAEIRRIEKAVVELAPPLEDSSEAEMAIHHGKLQNTWIPMDFGVTTHRSGQAGQLVLKAKRVLHKALGFITGIQFAQQTRFNDELVKLLNIMIPHHQALRQRMPLAEKRLDDLEDTCRDLAAQIREQTRHHMDKQEQLDRLKESDEYLNRMHGRDYARMETLLSQLKDLLNSQAQKGQIPDQALDMAAQARSEARGAAYLEFEDRHRGPAEKLAELHQVYMPIFKAACGGGLPLVDIGCGRGEFMESARDAGLSVKGLDMNPEMVATCQAKGLEAVEDDAVSFLRAQPDNSLGGIMMAQVIEHLSVEQLTETVSLAALKLAPGGAFVAETVNPACLTTFCGAFYLDITHQNPIHPEAARFLWQWAGLKDVDLIFLSPYPPEALLNMLPADEQHGLAQVFNDNMDRLNKLLYGYQDYAVVGRK